MHFSSCWHNVQLLVGYGMVASITLNNTYTFNAVRFLLIQADEELLHCLPLINPTIKYRQKNTIRACERH